MVDIKSVLRLVRDGLETYAPDYMHGLPKRDYLKQIDAALAQPEQCQCPACKVTPHASDCAVHNAPAYPVGECDCGAQPEQEPDDLTIAYMAGLSRGKELAPQRTWVGLTDEEISSLAFNSGDEESAIHSAIELLKEKNHA